MFVPIVRGDLKHALLWFLCTLAFGIGWIVFPFIYNKMYIRMLLEQGYKPI